MTVNKTALYRIFDQDVSESCADQEDEHGYLLITNTCNPQGYPIDPWPNENNNKWRIIRDNDNARCQFGQSCVM